jgi:hypothetical protein
MKCTWMLLPGLLLALLLGVPHLSALDEGLIALVQEHRSASMDSLALLITGLGDFFPAVKRTLVNFVVRCVKKMVPAWSIPRAVPLNRAMAQGAAARFSQVQVEVVQHNVAVRVLHSKKHFHDNGSLISRVTDRLEPSISQPPIHQKNEDTHGQ